MPFRNSALTEEAYPAKLNRLRLPKYGLQADGDPLFSSVLLLLPMNGANNSTIFTDVSSFGRTITTVGDAKISTARSKWGGSSGLFDGTGDFLTATVSGGLGAGNFTVEGWFYQTATSKTAWFNNRTAFTGADGIDTFPDGRIGTASVIIISSAATVPLNQWYHLALVRSGSTITRWVDGVSDGSGSNSANLNGPDWTLLGNNGNGAYLQGNCNDFRVTQAARYTAAFTPPAGPFPRF